mgnify:CR=1 FL=1
MSPSASTPSARSPIQSGWENLSPTWGSIGTLRVPLDFGDPDGEAARLNSLALADLSVLPKIGLKGPHAAEWLASLNVEVPERVYGCHDSDRDGLVARLDVGEFFLEAAIASTGQDGSAVERVSTALAKDTESGVTGVYRIERQDASLLVCGEEAHKVLEQTCGYHFRMDNQIENKKEHSELPAEQRSRDVVLTRVAGVSATVRALNLVARDRPRGVPAFRVWTSPSYGLYLWEAIAEIVRDLGGGPVGLRGLVNTNGEG